MGRQHRRQAEGAALGRRVRGRHQPDDEVPLRRRVGRQVPVRRRLQRRDRLGARAASARGCAPGRARDPQLRRLAPLPPDRHAWLKYVSGGMEEHFTKFGDSASSGYFTGVDWEDHLASLRQTQSAGQALPRHRALDAAATGPRRATAGRRCCSRPTAARRFALHDDYTDETWFPEYGYDLGSAEGPRDGRRRRAPQRVRARARARQPDRREREGALRRPLPRLGPGALLRHHVLRPHTGLILLPRPRGRRPQASGCRKRRVVRRALRSASASPRVSARARAAASITIALRGKRPARRRRPAPRRGAPHLPREGAPERQGPRRGHARPAAQRRRPRAPLSSRYSAS